MERNLKRSVGRRYVIDRCHATFTSAYASIGPAHAVYFATYETVKHAMGGNQGLSHEHHPLAAGMPLQSLWPSTCSIANLVQLLAARQQR